MGELKVKIETLTPLWTGGLDGTMDRIHETGILGSLRWWYEAIVRGLGGSACDPTQHEHELTGERLHRYERARREGKGWWEALDEAGICDVCKVFGTTGWRRRFKLEVRPIEGEFDITEGMFPSGRIHPDKRNSHRTGGWLLRGGYHGELELKFIGDEKVLWCEILPVLLFIEKWGSLGAKTSLGYDVFEILSINGGQKEPGQGWRELLQSENENNDPFGVQKCSSLVSRWWWDAQAPNSIYQGILPALTNMFFAKVRFSPKDSKWWKQFREIQWLNQGAIPEEKIIWTGHSQQRPSGPYEISNPLPVSRLQHWVECHNMFPIAPILRTRLRYSSHSVCNGSGENDWCKFMFGTVQGKSPVCGYCGTPVRLDKKDQNRWWCNTGKVSLDKSMVIHDAKRIQSKFRFSWAHQTSDGSWEIRIWGWLPENHYQDQHNKHRQNILQNLQKVLGVNTDKPYQWHIAQNNHLWQSLNISNPEICWFEKGTHEKTANFLRALLNNCKCKKETTQ